MPLDSAIQHAYIDRLEKELVCALGCTEPIALAYSASLAAAVLKHEPEHLHMLCSGDIIKNVKSVEVPNAEGLKGVEAAAVLGALGGDYTRDLQVLETITHSVVERARKLIDEGFCSVELAEEVPTLYIVATATSSGHEASVTIRERHTNVTAITFDGAPLDDGDDLAHVVNHGADDDAQDRPSDGPEADAPLTMNNICAFARDVDLDEVRDILERQIDCNTAISEEGLRGHWGSEIGRTILAARPTDVVNHMRARAAAGSDARMSGCALPVIINSGSGNQGMTASIPVIEYAHTIHASEDELLRALCISNLTAIHLKHYIGSLSAFCGVVCAAAGAGAAVTYLAGGTDDQIGATVVNTLANVGGIMCDGAKASCAAKIASAVDAAMLGHTMAMLDENFCAGDGLVQDDVESTIVSMGYVGRVGMHDTDVEILNIMIGKTELDQMGC